jgi:alpha-1,6-mannosyltransferase
MGIAAGAVEATGHTFVLTIWLLRFIALAAVLLSVWAIADIARRHGVSPPVAVAIGIANPIVVLHLVGGAHNDAILMAFLCAGFAFAQRGRFWLGVVFIALATAVKLPAAAALVYLAWCQPGAGAAVKERLKVVGKAFAVTAGIIVTACAVVGVGLSGWILAVRNTGTTTGTLSLPTRLGFVLSGLFHEAGLPSSDQVWIAVFRFIGLAVAAYVCLRLLGVVERVGPVAATGICLLAVMLLGPVVWPWYLAPAFALLGATQLGRWRASVLVLCALLAAEVFPVGKVSKPVLEGSHLVSLLLILLIAAISLAAPLAVDRWHALTEDANSGSPQSL